MCSRLYDKLFKTAAEGDIAGIIRLRSRCGDVLIQDDDDNTPLHPAEATACSSTSCVQP